MSSYDWEVFYTGFSLVFTVVFFIVLSLIMFIVRGTAVSRMKREGCWATMYVKDLRIILGKDHIYNVDVEFEQIFYCTEYRFRNMLPNAYVMYGQAFSVLWNPRERKIYDKEDMEKSLARWRLAFILFTSITAVLAMPLVCASIIY